MAEISDRKYDDEDLGMVLQAIPSETSQTRSWDENVFEVERRSDSLGNTQTSSVDLRCNDIFETGASEFGTFRSLKMPTTSEEIATSTSDHDSIMGENSNLNTCKRSQTQTAISRGVQTTLLKRSCASQTEDMTYSLFIFPSDNPIRRTAHRLATSDRVAKVLVAGAVLSTLCMLAMDPLQPLEAQRNALLFLTELAFAAIFLLETIVKVVAFGFVLSEESYLRSPWNIIDFTCVVSSVATLLSIWTPVHHAFLIMRRLRPLTIIRHVDSLRIRAEASVNTIVSFATVLSLLVLFVLFMGAVGLEFFKGTFLSRCIPNMEGSTSQSLAAIEYSFEDIEDYSLCGGQYSNCDDDKVCVDVGKNPNLGVTSFDNIALASLAVFQGMTLEGWTDIQQLIAESNGFYGSLVYMMIIVVLGALLIMNLALAVLYNSYIEQKDAISAMKAKREEALREKREEEERAKELENKEKAPLDLFVNPVANGLSTDAMYVAEISLKDTIKESMNLEGSDAETLEEDDPTRSSVLTALVLSPRFDMFFNAVLFVNVVFLMMYSYNASEIVLNLINWVNVICAVLFIVEFVLKILALGVVTYFSSTLNQLDAFLVAMSVIEFIFQLAKTKGVGQTALALRALRIARVFKFAKSWKPMREFTEALSNSWGNVKNLLGLMFLFLLTFALIGEEFLAGKLKDHRFHFDDSIWAMLTVFHVFTGENWNDGLFTGVGYYGWEAAPFFITVYIVGYTFFFNFLMSILIDSCLERLEKESLQRRKTDDGGTTSNLVNKTFGPLLSKRFRSSGSQDAAKDSLESLSDLHMSLEGKSFNLFSPSSPTRILLSKVTNSKPFEFTILFLIVASTVMLALDNPHSSGQDSTMIQVFDYLNIALAFVFLGEMLMHMIAMGVWENEGAYLRDGWNILDAVIVAISFIALLVPQIVFLRSLRAVRSLRIVSHNERLKVVVSALIAAMKKSGHIFAVGVLLVLTFAVIGVNLFSGSFGWCIDHPEIQHRTDCSGVVGNNITGELEELEWFQSHRNFNNVGNGALVLVELSSFEMWPDIMLQAIDSVGNDQAMKENARVWVIVYFIPVLMIMAFLYLNLFVGVVVQTYKLVKINDDTSNMPPLKRQWVNTLRFVKNQAAFYDPVPKKRRAQRFLYSIVTSGKFEAFFLVVVFCVFLVVIVQHHGQPDELTTATDLLSDIFVYMFLAEFVMKLFGLGPYEYFADRWNCLDFTLVIVTLAPKVFPSLDVLGWLRIIRLFRVIHLARRLPGVGNMIQAVISGVPQIVSALIVMMIIFYMYAVIAMNLFGGMGYEGMEFLGDQYNFRTFWRALFTLTRCSTGESYNGIMNDLSWCPSGIGCDFQHAAAPFLISFIVVVRFLLMNIILAMLLESYVDIVKRNGVVDRNLIRDFRKLWMEGDPYGSGYLPIVHLRRLLINLNHPLGLKRSQQQLTFCQLVPYIDHMNLDVYVFKSSKKISALFGESALESAEKNANRRSRELPLSLQKGPTRSGSVGEHPQEDEDGMLCFCVEFQDVLQALSARYLLHTTQYHHTKHVIEYIRLNLAQSKKSRNRRLLKRKITRNVELSMEELLEQSETSAKVLRPSFFGGLTEFMSRPERGNIKPDFVLEGCTASQWLAVHAIEIQWIGRSARKRFVKLVEEVKDSAAALKMHTRGRRQSITTRVSSALFAPFPLQNLNFLRNLE